MLGRVKQQPDHRRGQSRATHFARLEQRRGIGRAKLRERALHRRVELRDERRWIPSRSSDPPFLAQRGELVARELLAARVREQPIEAADRVAHVIARRRGAAGRAHSSVAESVGTVARTSRRHCSRLCATG